VKRFHRFVIAFLIVVRDSIRTFKFQFTNQANFWPRKVTFSHLEKISLPETSLYVNNLSLFYDGKDINVVARLTNSTYERISRVTARWIPRDRKSLIYQGLCRFKLSLDGRIWDYSELKAPSRVPCYEDPRFSQFDSRSRVYCSKVIKQGLRENPGWIVRMSVLDLDTLEDVEFCSPNNNSMEKNWIPLPSIENQYSFIYSSKPLSIARFNSNGNLIDMHFPNSPNLRLNYNGASNSVEISRGIFLRLVRKRFTILGLGTGYFSFALVHDSEMVTIFESSAFFLQKFGIEICNSICLIDDFIYFAFSLDEKDNFIGGVKLESFLAQINYSIN
jgi:hypothetical protein